MAARLCEVAKPGDIQSGHLLSLAEDLVEAGQDGEELSLKGFLRPVAAFNVLGLRRVDRR